MVSGGRIVCVAIPFLLTIASVVALLIAALAGVTTKSLYIFSIDTTNLSISTADAASLLDTRSVALPTGLDVRAESPDDLSGNFTATDLGLGKVYDFFLWNYCERQQNGSLTCSKPAFNYVETTLNASEKSVDTLISSTGVDLKIPDEITKAIAAFGTIARITEIVYIVAFVCLAIQTVFGFFTGCSRISSCLAFLVGGVTVVAVVASAALSTTMGTIVIGAIEGGAKKYGVTAQLGTHYMVAVWIAAVCAVGASFFWMFTICCCSPERSAHRRHHVDRAMSHDKMPMAAGAYQPLSDPTQAGHYGNTAYAPASRFPQSGRSAVAYEPYSHSRV